MYTQVSTGRSQEMLCILFDWLFSISPNRCKKPVGTITFNNTELLAVSDKTGQKWVAAKPICLGMGLAWNGQHVKLKADPKYRYADIYTPDARGCEQKHFCLPFEQLNGWLFSINTNKCKKTIRPAIIKYQQECMNALYDYWNNGAANLYTYRLSEAGQSLYNKMIS
jgi:hypothetical protein